MNNLESRDFSSMAEAARALLCEACALLGRLSQEFVVIGGWSPFLRNQGDLVHPGTKDVDILFGRGANEGALSEVITEFLASGFVSSAKHPFQLLIPLTVRGRSFVYNIDLLHPSPTRDTIDMFVDHLVIDDAPLLYRYQSIKVPMSTLLFEECGHEVLSVDSPLGSTVDVPLMTDIGTIITKLRSMSNPKRPRDAFDVFVAIVQTANRDRLVDAIIQNCLQDHFEKLWELTRIASHRANIARYWLPAADEEPWAAKAALLERFLDDAGIERPEGEE